MKRSEFLGLLVLPFLVPLIKLEDKPTGKGLLAQIRENKSTYVESGEFIEVDEIKGARCGDGIIDEHEAASYCISSKNGITKLYYPEKIKHKPSMFIVFASRYHEDSV